ncbi:hypothetical protein V6N13_112493 [Hibiscus sabdariffa]
MTDVLVISEIDCNSIVVEWTKVKTLDSGSSEQVQLAKLQSLVSDYHFVTTLLAFSKKKSSIGHRRTAQGPKNRANSLTFRRRAREIWRYGCSLRPLMKLETK